MFNDNNTRMINSNIQISFTTDFFYKIFDNRIKH